MSRETELDKLTRTKQGMRLYQQERAILDVTELICQLMDEEHVTRSVLAGRLGRSKGYVTQLLDGRANMTVRTISDVFVALGRALHFQDGALSQTVSAEPWMAIRFDQTIARARPWAKLKVQATKTVHSRLAS